MGEKWGMVHSVSDDVGQHFQGLVWTSKYDIYINITCF